MATATTRMSGRKSLEVRAAAACAAVILIGGGTRAALAVTTFVPSIGADAAWSDNLDLGPPGQEQPGEVYDLQPGLQLIHDSALEHVTLDYTLYALSFNGGHHDFLQSGKLVSITQVIPRWFELDLSGERTQGAADPALPSNSQFLLPISNLANYTNGVIRPILKHAFHDFQIQASYTRGFGDSGLVSGLASPTLAATLGSSYRSNDRDAGFTVSSVDRDARLTWAADYERDQLDYESPYFLTYRDDQADAQLGLLTISTLRLIARGGKESNPQNGISQGGLQASYWAGGFDWSTGPRDELRFLIGHRFFGRTYEATWRREARLLKLEIDYTEQPTTQDALQMQQPLSAPASVQLPGTPGFTRLSPDVFLDKSLSGAATLTGRLTEVGVSVQSDDRIYYAIASLAAPAGVMMGPAAYEDRQQSAALFANRQLGPLMTLALSASYGKDNLREGAQAGYTTQIYSAVLTRNLGQRSSVYLRGYHVEQHGGMAGYSANIVSLGFKFYFGHGAPAESFGAGMGSGMGYGPY